MPRRRMRCACSRRSRTTRTCRRRGPTCSSRPRPWRPTRVAVRVLGLDPGSLHTGYGLIERRGSELLALAHGRISCPRGKPLPERLAHLAAALAALLDLHHPDAVALEAVFHGANSRSLIVLAQARGALEAAVGAGGPRAPGDLAAD